MSLCSKLSTLLLSPSTPETSTPSADVVAADIHESAVVPRSLAAPPFLSPPPRHCVHEEGGQRNLCWFFAKAALGSP